MNLAGQEADQGINLVLRWKPLPLDLVDIGGGTNVNIS